MFCNKKRVLYAEKKSLHAVKNICCTLREICFFELHQQVFYNKKRFFSPKNKTTKPCNQKTHLYVTRISVLLGKMFLNTEEQNNKALRPKKTRLYVTIIGVLQQKTFFFTEEQNNKALQPKNAFVRDKNKCFTRKNVFKH
eukprot:GEMP01072119.1.p1 GENE.GEMP01072119.1~~GEMP01072119.1.p1  ORF type:complete len:140 (-),score=7.15 GEMP01072119.1:60-479(-)